jgi:molecular chaperone Hsp33
MNAAVPPPTDDIVQPFQIETSNLRGRLVRLGPVVDSVLRRHDYPAPVATMLGEALTLCAALASALKFDGVFTLQAKGDGPISMLVADYRSPGDLRGYASFDAAKLEAAAKRAEGFDATSVPRMLGAGYLAFTVDQGPDTERYQGIVALEGATLADCAHAYFRQSEQLEAGIRLAVERDTAGRWHSGALMLQRLPPKAGADLDEEEDAWRRALTFLGTVRHDELAQAQPTPRQLLYRLFHEDGVRAFEPVLLREKCRCSEERVLGVLRSFPAGERQDMAEAGPGGRIRVTCEFCNRMYDFDPADVDAPPPATDRPA